MIKALSLPTAWRPPTIGEWKLAGRVFGNTLPRRETVMMTNGAGLGGRAFVVTSRSLVALPGAGVALVAAVKLWKGVDWCMNLGGKYSPRLEWEDPGLLVHETTHVWQGHNGATAENFMAESVLAQGYQTLTGAEAYAYAVGKRWAAYNPEQQASMVTDWFVDGLREDEKADNRWPYIRDYVRRGRPAD